MQTHSRTHTHTRTNAYILTWRTPFSARLELDDDFMTFAKHPNILRQYAKDVGVVLQRHALKNEPQAYAI